MVDAAGKRQTQLDRIEAKLDALIEALAEEREGDGIEAGSLDGGSVSLPAADPRGYLGERGGVGRKFNRLLS